MAHDPLVGRQEELAVARAALQGEGSGGLTAVLLTGEGGIGKSRLLAELVGDIERREWQVLSARADQLERQIPYAALARALSASIDDTDPEVAGLGGEVVATLDLLGGRPRAELESSFGQACGQTTRLLRSLLERRPLAIVVDDVHALDDDTLALLAIVLRRVTTGRLAFLGASRSGVPSGHPALDGLLARLAADGSLREVPLGPLDAEAIASLVTRVLGTEGDAALVDQVSAGAEGNPFFALEIAASIVSTGAGAPVSRDRWAAVLQRFAPLNPGARAVLRAIAVLGRLSIGDLGLVAEMTALGDDAVAAAFDELVAAGVLQSAGELFTFAHDLVREAVYADVGPAEQRRLHRTVATRLLSDRDSGRPVDVLALARHASAAAEVGDAQAAALLVEAGDRHRALGPGTAAALYARALELLPTGAPERASVLSRRCRALVLATQPADAVEAGRQALEGLPPGTAERSRTATAVIGSLFELGRIEDALAVADRELALGRAGPVVEAQRPMLLWFAGRYDEARQEWERVRHLPVATDAERILVLGQHAFCAATFEWPALSGIVAELEALARAAPATGRLFAITVAGYTLALDGYVDRALPLVQQAEAMLDDAGGTPFRGNILVARVVIDWLQGRWDEAIEGARSAAAELEGAQLLLHLGAFDAAEIDIRTHRGEQVPLELVERQPPTINMADLKAHTVAGILESRGDVDGVRTLIGQTLQRGNTAYLSPMLGRLIELDMAAGDERAAKEALQALEEGALTMRDPWTATVLWRSRALVARDAEAARTGVDVAGHAGLAFERARTQVALGRVDPGEVDGLVDAYRTFQALGADRERRRAGALLTDRGAKVPRQRSSRSGPLTHAELAIARLVQQGMRNKEIATFLHYSPRTVEVYLSRIYNKLSVSSRLELARALDARPFD